MLAEQRRRKILEYIQEAGSAKVSHLSQMLRVTEPTIRQDLAKLEKDGLVVRKHGGAFLKTIPGQIHFESSRQIQNQRLKQLIGKVTAEYVHSGDSIILDSGTTTLEIASQLEQKIKLKVVTPDIGIAIRLGSTFNEIIMTGGEFKPMDFSFTGELAAKFFDSNIFVNKLFLGVAGISSEGRLTCPSMSQIPVKQAMMSAAKEIFIVADSTKFGKVDFAYLGDIAQAQHLVTDSGIPEQYYRLLKGKGVDVIIAE